ncbi:Methylenetetrahydrofolate reductase [Tepidanaerobacter acetatoxydans Re1]|uniref:Methylenetetrahydrofolate reductase n=1 Tax=Tepidanaerobacter acetatoxydans (strain DSM 21804 / JCM 16047 / Re1) TaxID=1209989 RepID=F4LVP6_TEPAE|nr:methylenetetrahydrofolate reductase [Tepidanaerobacter acetatoxydans]AEE90743.1 methylenetetrahydrofolate reductase [Tepidanaerobacter acetatoxydans Re1]CCP25296.1 Methylenetetrahydrofolate reductase [Tepidanaerobacter acetatoxydans Re1]
MGLKEKLEHNEFAITAEMAPPKGIDFGRIRECAQAVKGRVDAVNVTDFQSAVVRSSSLGGAKVLLEEGLEPVMQITGRDRNRIAIQGELLSAAALGIKNILALTGDHPSIGDHPEARGVFDMDSVGILQAATKLMNGEDFNGHELSGIPEYFLGASVTPLYEPVELQIIKMVKKIQAGARFFQTQAVYDIDVIKGFMDKIKDLDAKVLVGVIPLKSAGMAKHMNNNVPGIHVPDEIIDKMKKAQDKEKEGLNIAAEFIKQVREEKICAGVHIMAVGAEENLPVLFDMCGF